MKKLFTLAFGLFSLVLFAAGRTPSVTITTSNNHEVWVDGKNYFTQTSGNTVTIPDMQVGNHTIEVYQVTNKIFRKDRTLVTRSGFNLNDRDLIINVDNNGQLNIRESGNTVNQQNDRTVVTNPDGTTTTVGGNGKVGNNSDRRTRGRGHKYGHNKEWKAEKMKNKELKNKDDRDDDDGDDDNKEPKNKTKESKSKNKPEKNKGKK